MEFDYYYGSQADQFSFIRIPRMLLTEETFSSLTLQSKMLYSVLLDRMSLSMKNGWFDEENRVYIIYQISEIQSDLGFSKRKAMDYLAELETFGLVQKKKERIWTSEYHLCEELSDPERLFQKYRKRNFCRKADIFQKYGFSYL